MDAMAKVKLKLRGRHWITYTKRLRVRSPDLVRPTPPTRKQIMALQDELTRKRRAAEVLQKRVRNEKQFAKQMELNSEART